MDFRGLQNAQALVAWHVAAGLTTRPAAAKEKSALGLIREVHELDRHNVRDGHFRASRQLVVLYSRAPPHQLHDLVTRDRKSLVRTFALGHTRCAQACSHT